MLVSKQQVDKMLREKKIRSQPDSLAKINKVIIVWMMLEMVITMMKIWITWQNNSIKGNQRNI